jgi:putative ABC transport system permease protein
MTVVGVLKPQGESILGNSPDQQILTPVNFARKFTDLRSDKLNPFIMVKALPGISNAQLKDDIRKNLRAIRRLKPTAEDNFALNESSLLEFGLRQLFSMLNIVGSVIGLFALLVGGFGIANIMFVSVRERTAIIGIQKALGAHRSFIIVQFLTEAVVLCLIGGIIGIAFIRLGTFIVSEFFDFGVYLSLQNIITGLSLSAIIGIIAGLIPAWKAAKLHPVEAMRTGV